MKIRTNYYLWFLSKSYTLEHWIFSMNNYPYAHYKGYNAFQFTILGLQIGWATPIQ